MKWVHNFVSFYIIWAIGFIQSAQGLNVDIQVQHKPHQNCDSIQVAIEDDNGLSKTYNKFTFQKYPNGWKLSNAPLCLGIKQYNDSLVIGHESLDIEILTDGTVYLRGELINGLNLKYNGKKITIKRNSTLSIKGNVSLQGCFDLINEGKLLINGKLKSEIDEFRNEGDCEINGTWQYENMSIRNEENAKLKVKEVVNNKKNTFISKFLNCGDVFCTNNWDGHKTTLINQGGYFNVAGDCHLAELNNRCDSISPKMKKHELDCVHCGQMIVQGTLRLSYGEHNYSCSRLYVGKDLICHGTLINCGAINVIVEERCNQLNLLLLADIKVNGRIKVKGYLQNAIYDFNDYKQHIITTIPLKKQRIIHTLSTKEIYTRSTTPASIYGEHNLRQLMYMVVAQEKISTEEMDDFDLSDDYEEDALEECYSDPYNVPEIGFFSLRSMSSIEEHSEEENFEK